MKLKSFLTGNRSAGAIILLFALVIGFAFYSSNANIGTFSITLLSGLLRAMLLFLVAAGLSLIFGLMDILNFAQGAYFMIGAYVAYDIQHPDMGFLNFANGIESPEIRFAVGIVSAILVGAALGWLLERVLLRPLYSRPLFQLVLTFGVSIILLEVIRALWGTTPLAGLSAWAFRKLRLVSSAVPSAFTVYLSLSWVCWSWRSSLPYCVVPAWASPFARVCRMPKWSALWASMSRLCSRWFLL